MNTEMLTNLKFFHCFTHPLYTFYSYPQFQTLELYKKLEERNIKISYNKKEQQWYYLSKQMRIVKLCSGVSSDLYVFQFLKN